MRNLLGFPLLAFGIWFIYSALAQRRRVLARRAQVAALGESDAAAPLHPSLATLGDVMPPLVILGLGFVAAKASLAYFVMDLSHVLSLFDLAGFLILLTGYGTWFVFKTTYRELETVSTPIDEQNAALRVVEGGGRQATDESMGADHGRGSPAVRAPDRLGGMATGLAAAGQGPGGEGEAGARGGRPERVGVGG